MTIRHSSECQKMLHGVSLVGCLKVKWDNDKESHYDSCCDGYQDLDYQDTERWTRELLTAGWKIKSLHIWQSPSGALHLGPFGAWRRMKRELKCSGTHAGPRCADPECWNQ